MEHICTPKATIVIHGQSISQTQKCLENDDPTAHAVVESVRTLKKLRLRPQQVQDCRVYVEQGICPMCAAALRNYHIKYVMMNRQEVEITKFYFQTIL